MTSESDNMDAMGMLSLRGELAGQSPAGYAGGRLIKRLNEIPTTHIEEEKLLQIRTEAALSFTEGLRAGARYDLDKDGDIEFLYNLFLTVDYSRERSPTLIPEEIKKRTIDQVGQMNETALEESRELTPEEIKRKALLMDVHNHAVARQTIDVASTQRQMTCEVAEKMSNLFENGKDTRYRDTVTPDKTDWANVFKGEWGEKVDTVLREIVETGEGFELKNSNGEVTKDKEGRPVKVDPFANGFKTTDEFRTWIGNLYEKSGQRMDVVWFAWKIAQLWEISSELGIREIIKTIEYSDGRKEEHPTYKIGDPPIVSDMFGWIINPDAKRRGEYGLAKDGFRTQQEKYLTHSGLPLSIGHIPPLCQNYLKESKVGKGTNKKSLWQLWQKEGVKLSELPWTKTEVVVGVGEELPPASFGGWMMKRFRAMLIVKDLRARHSLSDLASPSFFEERVRNWSKVLGTVKPGTRPEENPRVWWLTAQIFYHQNILHL